MRDEGRIMPLVMQVGRLWQYSCPDIRFMQLISNFAVWYGADPFYMEDDEFLKKFKEYMAEMDYVHAPSVIHKTSDGASYM